MAAIGYTPIYLYYSSTVANVPLAANLGYGELALNITDKNLFFKDNTNTVNTIPIRQSSAGSNGWLSSTDWLTFNNKVSSQWTTSGAFIYYPGGVSIGNTTDPGAGALNVTNNAWIGSGGDLLGSNRRMSVAGQCAATFKSQDSAYVVLDVWNPGTSGDNTFQIFFTETSATGRGSITYNRAGGLVAYNTTSDYRAKTIRGDVTNSGEIIDLLKVYDGIMNGASVSRPMLVAHEAQEITPYAVTGEKDAVNEDGTPKYQQMDVSAYVPLLIAEIQQLRKRVAELENK